VMLGLSALLLGASTSAHAGGTSSIPDTRPGWATPGNRSGQAPDGSTVVFSMWLGWRNQSGLDALLARQQEPASRGYHRWLTPARFRSRFAPGRDDVREVSDWLDSEGFDLVSVPHNHLFVTATGSVSQVEHAFHVNESLYQVSGQTVRAPDADPRIPD